MDPPGSVDPPGFVDPPGSGDTSWGLETSISRFNGMRDYIQAKVFGTKAEPGRSELEKMIFYLS